jgi:N-hydroxyarylamine O-acetyltransferase
MNSLVAAYLKRVGFAGKPAPTLETLQALHGAHPQAIPFEGFSPFLGEAVPLDIDAVHHKLVERGRGGYCFEHNVLFWKVLQALGFRVRGLSARVRLNWPEDVVTPRSHMLLLVSLPEGDYLADVGFGGLTLTAAVRLETGIEQRTPHEPARVTESGGLRRLQVRLGGEWKTLYSFDLEESFMADYEMYNWYFAAHPQSPFVNGLIMARPEPGRRHALRNTRYSVHSVDGHSESRQLQSVEAFRSVVRDAFGLAWPDGARFEEKLARLIEEAQA